jgi:uncharacterized protein YndB with AHSA1/START domain
MPTHSVSATRVIAASPERLFGIIADPSMHAVIDGSGSVRGVKGGSRTLALGDRFTTSMRLGVPYVITNRVVEYEEGSVIAWAHLGGWRWRYELVPLDDEDGEPRTRVTETFDWSSARSRLYVEKVGWPRKNQLGMERTLDRLEAYVANKSSTV